MFIRSEHVHSVILLVGFMKDKVSANNPCTEEELKKSVRDVEPSVSPAEPRRVMNRQVCGSKETFSSTFCMYTLA